MKKSTATSIAFAVSSLTVVTASQEASAQLNVGEYSVQQGQEFNYLRSQLSGVKSSELRGIAECDIGFGFSCNKTGAMLQRIVEANNGPTHKELLIKAAGGEDNFQELVKFFSDAPNFERELEQIPYASFWKNDDPTVLDGARYTSLGERAISRVPEADLGGIAKKFYWAPIRGVGDSLDPRSGLLNLKYSYTRLLVEEFAKIPNGREQLQAQVGRNESNYYWNKYSRALNALKSGNEALLKQSSQEVVSLPYLSKGGDELGRTNLKIPDLEEVDWIGGKTLMGDAFELEPFIALEPETADLVSFVSEGAVVTRGAGPSNLYWLGLLALLPFLFGGDGNSSSTPPSVVTPPVAPPVVTPPVVTPPVVTPPVVTPPVVTPPEKVPEPSTVTPYALLAIIMFMLTQKQWRLQTKD